MELWCIGGTHPVLPYQVWPCVAYWLCNNVSTTGKRVWRGNLGQVQVHFHPQDSWFAIKLLPQPLALLVLSTWSSQNWSRQPLLTIYNLYIRCWIRYKNPIKVQIRRNDACHAVWFNMCLLNMSSARPPTELLCWTRRQTLGRCVSSCSQKLGIDDFGI